MPKFSIIVPVCGVEKYLRDCIDSALAQTYTDFELILVDDGSPDRCGEIIDSYAAEDKRILPIHKKNGGLSDARNAGLNAASGEFIYFLDGDDMMRPRLLETVLPLMDSGLDMVVFNHFADQTELPPGRRCSYEYHFKGVSDFLLASESARYSFITGPLRDGSISWEVWNRVFRRDLIERWSLRFVDNREIFAEDLYFTFCYTAHASRVRLITDDLYVYRRRPDSLSNDAAGRLYTKEYDRLARHLREHYRRCEDCSYLAAHFEPLYYFLQTRELFRVRILQRRRRWTFEKTREYLRGVLLDYDEFARILTKICRDRYWRERLQRIAKPLNQKMDLIYLEELLEMPVPPWKKLYNKAALGTAFFLTKLRDGVKRVEHSPEI